MKRLASMNSGDGGNTLMFTYDESGMRLSKLDFAGNKNHKYTIAGDKLTGERCENMDGSVLYTTQFVYDNAGEAVSMVYNGVEYYFVRNGQRDVIGLIDGNGNIVVNYTYDSWGKLLKIEGNTEVGYRNPLRYRGYIADDETGLYYVGSRYYDPVVGRWISADDVAFIGATGDFASYNLYVYCGNNSVNQKDSMGYFSIVLGLVCAAINVGTSYLAAKVTGQEYTWKNALVDGAVGFLSAGKTVAKVAAAVISVGVDVYSNYKNGNPISESIVSNVAAGIMSVVGISSIISKSPTMKFMGKAESIFVTTVFDTGDTLIKNGCG